MRARRVLKPVIVATCAAIALSLAAVSVASAASYTLRNGATTTMNVGDTATTETLNFKYGANVRVTWESTNTSVASLGYESIGMSMVSSPFGSGIYETHSMDVRANRPGTATITATTKAGVQGTYTIVVNKLKESVPVPGTSSFAYTGDQITFMSSGSHYTVSNGSATNAGTYTAVVSLTDTSMYEWTDGTVAPKTFTWTIDKAEVAIPSAAKNLVYNGTEQTGIESGELYRLEGDHAALGAGTYTATAVLLDPTNYRWSDGSLADQTISWEIAKAKNPMKAKAKKATLKQSFTKKQTTTVSVSKAQGKVSFKSLTKSVKVNKKGVVTFAKGFKGTVRIQVSAAGSENYRSAKQTVTIKVK